MQIYTNLIGAALHVHCIKFISNSRTRNYRSCNCKKSYHWQCLENNNNANKGFSVRFVAGVLYVLWFKLSWLKNFQTSLILICLCLSAIITIIWDNKKTKIKLVWRFLYQRKFCNSYIFQVLFVDQHGQVVDDSMTRSHQSSGGSRFL